MQVRFGLLLYSCLWILSCGQSPKVNVHGNYFGEKISSDGAISGVDLLSLMKTVDSAEVKVNAPITSCCQKKGCWMDVELGDGETMQVTFKDYGFFVPKDAAGKTAIMEGIARKEIQSVEWLRHKAEDEGKTPEEIALITEPTYSITFEAKGVIIN
jgi:hypothetical protein